MPSSVIYSMEYDERSLSLRITYMSGSVYVYKKVPVSVFYEMKEATSKGAYLNTHIKGNYAFEKVSD